MSTDSEFLDALRAEMAAALREAMRKRDGATVSVLRTLLHAVDNLGSTGIAAPQAGLPVAAASAELQRHIPTRAELLACLQRERDERDAAAHTYADVGRAAEAERLRGEINVVDVWIQRAQSIS